MPIWNWLSEAYGAFTGWSGWDVPGQWGWVQFLSDSFVGDALRAVFGFFGAIFGFFGSVIGYAGDLSFNYLAAWLKLPALVLLIAACLLTIQALYCLTVWVRCRSIGYNPEHTLKNPMTGDEWSKPIDLVKGRKRAVTWPLLLVPHLLFALYMLHRLYSTYTYETYKSLGVAVILTGPPSAWLYVCAMRWSYNRSHPERPIISSYWDMIKGYYRGADRNANPTMREQGSVRVDKDYHIVPVWPGVRGWMSRLINGLAWVWMHIKGVVQFWKWPWLDLLDIFSFWRLLGVIVLAILAPFVLLLRPFMYLIAAESFRGKEAPTWVEIIAQLNHIGKVGPWWMDSDRYFEPEMAPEPATDKVSAKASA